jgi:hypothetical protein
MLAYSSAFGELAVPPTSVVDNLHLSAATPPGATAAGWRIQNADAEGCFGGGTDCNSLRSKSISHPKEVC